MISRVAWHEPLRVVSDQPLVGILSERSYRTNTVTMKSSRGIMTCIPPGGTGAERSIPPSFDREIPSASAGRSIVLLQTAGQLTIDRGKTGNTRPRPL